MNHELPREALIHLDMLYNLARRMTTSKEDAEDVVQETYVRAVRGWRRKPPQQMAPWLATICMNAARSQHRSRKVRKAELLHPQPEEIDPSAADTSARAIEGLDAEAVHRALAQLPAEQREAIALMDLCGFTAAEVAEMRGIPRGTVLSRVHRGHKRLAVLLEEVMRLDP